MSFDSDFNHDKRELRRLQHQMEKAEREGLATQAALAEHSVTKYVKRLPVESTLYPAIEYLVLADRMGRDVEEVRDHFRMSVQEIVKGPHDQLEGILSQDVQESPSVQEGSSLPITTLDSFSEDCGNQGIPIPVGQEIESLDCQGIQPLDCQKDHDQRCQETPVSDEPGIDPAFDGINDPYVPREFIVWSMPAHDLTRPQRKRCGFIRASNGSMVYSACPEDAEHYIKGKRRHCWSLHCPECMNDTALKRGIAVEKRLLTYAELSRKKGQDPGKIGHWVISPPQELVKSLCQSKPEFDDLNKYVELCMKEHGAKSGVQIFHPWRQTEDEWEFSPHFHILCYGFIDTRSFLRQNPGWIIKKVHAKEDIKSIRHTAAYLFTHMGLPLYEKDPDDIDWGLEVLNYLVPGIKSKGGDYQDDDWSKKGENRGRMVGDLSGVDWVQWTIDRLTGKLELRYWGGASYANIRKLDIIRQYRIRVCKECGTPLRTYNGSEDAQGSYVRYIQDDPVLVFRDDYDQAKEIVKEYGPKYRDAGLTIADLARDSNFAVSTLELPSPPNNDLVMPGPFAEPDEYFLSRQKMAFGQSDSIESTDTHQLSS